MSRLNRREKKFVADMTAAGSNLEMRHRTDYDDCDELVQALCGWYAYAGGELLRLAPLITDAEVAKYHVDVNKCFEEVGANVRSDLGCRG